MEIALIAAIASNRAIGVNNKMPWHLSADLKRFKQLTMGFPIIMGRKTFESIAKPLPGRTNIIISRNLSWQQPGCLVFTSLEQALLAAEQLSERVFVIGGATLYQALLPQASVLYLTEIQQDFAGDTFFP
ncbi:dihydrofolate reductase, partial [Methylocucumis oryzae]|uniref:dihydrofolate reductase n=1 Tax=Methylocucumis oryzae TaxID=1632867 RepID=UPI0005F33826